MIYNPATDTVAGLLSLSRDPSVITLPSGYTFAAMVTAVYNNGSSNLVTYRQAGNRIDFERNPTDFAYLSGGSSVTYSLLSPNVPSGVFDIEREIAQLTGGGQWSFSLDGSTIWDLYNFVAVSGTMFIKGRSMLNASQQEYYSRTAGSGTLTLTLRGLYL